MCENKSFHFHAGCSLVGRKKTSRHLFFPPSPWLKDLGWGAELLELHRINSNWAQKKCHVVVQGVSCGTCSTEQSQNPVSPPYNTLHPGNKLLISVLGIYWRQKIGCHQIPSTAQKKLADGMTSSFPTACHFSVLLHISTPKPTEIVFFPAPDFWNNVAGDFPSSTVYSFPKAT